MARKTTAKMFSIRLYNEVASDKKIVKILSQLPGNIGVQQFVKNAILEYFANHSNKTTGEFSVSLSEGDVRSILDDSVASKSSIIELKDVLGIVLEKEDLLQRELNELKLAIIQQGSRSVSQIIPQMVPSQMQVASGAYVAGVSNTQPISSPDTVSAMPDSNLSEIKKDAGDEVQPLSNPSSDVLGFLEEMGM